LPAAGPLLRINISTSQFQDKEGATMLRTCLAGLALLTLLTTAPAVPPKVKLRELQTAIASPSAQTRLEAVQGAGNLGTAASRLVPDIAGVIRRDTDHNVANEAAATLAQIGPAAVPELIKALRSQNPTLRQRAAWSLARFGPDGKAAVPALIEALKDTRPAVRQLAAIALGEIGADAGDATDALVELIRDPNDKVRQQAVIALGLLTPDAVIPPLCKLLESDEEAVRCDAARVLSMYGREAKAAVPALAAAVKDNKAAVRLAAIRALTCVGAEAGQAMPALLDALQSKHYDTQVAAFQAVLQIGHKDFPGLLKSLREINDKGEWAVYLLPQFGAAAREAVPALVDALKDVDPTIRQGAAVALGQLGPDAAPAIPALVPLLKDPSPAVRLCVVRVLQRLDGTEEALVLREMQWQKIAEQTEQQVWQAMATELEQIQKLIEQRTRGLGIPVLKGPPQPGQKVTFNWRAFNDPVLQRLYKRLYSQYVGVSVMSKTDTLKPDAKLFQDKTVRNLLQGVGPEAIPALVHTLTMIDHFKQGFC
jgi:HEAT repeat protein